MGKPTLWTTIIYIEVNMVNQCNLYDVGICADILCEEVVKEFCRRAILMLCGVLLLVKIVFPPGPSYRLWNWDLFSNKAASSLGERASLKAKNRATGKASLQVCRGSYAPLSGRRSGSLFTRPQRRDFPISCSLNQMSLMFRLAFVSGGLNEGFLIL